MIVTSMRSIFVQMGLGPMITRMVVMDWSQAHGQLLSSCTLSHSMQISCWDIVWGVVTNPSNTMYIGAVQDTNMAAELSVLVWVHMYVLSQLKLHPHQKCCGPQGFKMVS